VTGVRIRPFTDGEEDAVVALWHAAGLVRPWNDPHRDIARKKQVQRELFLVAEDAGAVVGTAMAGYDGHRGWVYYLAVSPASQRSGLGRAMMRAAEEWLAARDVVKVQLMVRHTNAAALGFYERLGYADAEVRVLGRWLRPTP
jgi:ribosomal protein S18 acetylase RimI-like enzyme